MQISYDTGKVFCRKKNDEPRKRTVRLGLAIRMSFLPQQLETAGKA